MRPSTIGHTRRVACATIAVLCGAAGLLPATGAAQTHPSETRLTQSRSQLSLITRQTDIIAPLQVAPTAHSPTAPSSSTLGLHHSRSKIVRDRHHHEHSPDYVPFLNVKYGTYDPQGSQDGGSFLGFRSGAEFDGRLTVAFNLDTYWRSFTEEMTIAQEVDRNGNVIRTSLTSFETTSALIPLGVSLGLRLPGTNTLTPFVGVGVAYEILVNHIEDFATGVEDTNVYGGPGWQLFGGLMFPVTTHALLLGELWLNDAEVSRDVEEYSQGLPVRETIDVSGFGARFGVEFQFN